MKIIKALVQKNMLIAFLMGFSSGLPLLLTGKTLQGLLSDSQIGLTTIGLFALVGIPYTLKFLWAPIFDRFSLPFLGRRRGWLLVIQICLAASILLIAVTPANGELPMSQRVSDSVNNFLFWLHKDLPNSQLSLVLVGACFLVSFFSASQDIVVDAYRRESMKEEELGMGSTLYIYGYRLAMWVAGGLAFILADKISWPVVYTSMACFMSVGILTTLLIKEPAQKHASPKNLHETVVLPLKEFFTRKSVANALSVLAFILLYKVGDTIAGQMTTPFYKSIGFSNADIGTIAKTFGFFSAMVGGFIGGALILKIGIPRALIIFGFLQAASTACFAILASVGNSLMALTFVIAFEDITGAMGTAAFAAYMAAQTNTKFTATQYALLTSLMGVPRVFIAAPAGKWAESMGWTNFFFFCTAAAIPGMVLLFTMLAVEKRKKA